MPHTVDIILCFPELIYAPFVTETLMPLMQERSVRRFLCKVGMRSEYAREILLDEFMAGDSEWVFVLDTDMIMPPRVLPRLLVHNKKMIGVFYVGRGEKKYPVIFPPDPIHEWPKRRYFEYPKDRLIEVGATGHGGLLIHRSIFEKMSKPWSQLGPYDGNNVVGSDIRLCLKAREEAGVKIYVDTSLKAGHLTPYPITESDWERDKIIYAEEWQRYLKNKEGT